MWGHYIVSLRKQYVLQTAWTVKSTKAENEDYALHNWLYTEVRNSQRIQ